MRGHKILIMLLVEMGGHKILIVLLVEMTHKQHNGSNEGSQDMFSLRNKKKYV